MNPASAYVSDQISSVPLSVVTVPSLLRRILLRLLGHCMETSFLPGILVGDATDALRGAQRTFTRPCQN